MVLDGKENLVRREQMGNLSNDWGLLLRHTINRAHNLGRSTGAKMLVMTTPTWTVTPVMVSGRSWSPENKRDQK